MKIQKSSYAIISIFSRRTRLTALLREASSLFNASHLVGLIRMEREIRTVALLNIWL